MTSARVAPPVRRDGGRRPASHQPPVRPHRTLRPRRRSWG